MTVERQVVFWIAAAFGFLLILYLFSPILLPFVAGAAVAYALDPIADWFERRGFSRVWATLTILIIFVIIFAILLVSLVPVLVNQLAGLINNIPTYVEKLQALLSPLLDSELARFLKIDSESLRTSLTGFLSQGAGWLTTVVGSLWSGGQALIGVISLFVVTPVVAFYLLYDWDRLMAQLDTLLPRKHADTIRHLGRDIGIAISGFVRGQGLLCIFLGIFYAAGLAIVGLNFGLLIGIAAGVLSFIPYIGTILGFVVALTVAFVQFSPDWIWVFATACVFIVGQFIEGNILQPKLVGSSVGLHPVWLMFALVAFGYMFGFVGLLVAVPTAAALGVLVRFAIRRYRESPLYTGEPLPHPRPRRRVEKP